MNSVLIVTVGGSPQPILTAVQTLQPDRVVFLCSGGKSSSATQVIGEGKPCKIFSKGKIEKELSNLPTHLGLGERFDPDRDLVIIDALDDAAECYRVAAKTIAGLLQEFDRRQIMADYTGGTKSMSMGLAMAAIDYDIDLFVTTAAERTDLIRVPFGEVTERVTTSVIEVERRMNQFLPVFLAQYNYPAAVAQLQELLVKNANADMQTRRRIRDYLDYCKALDAWDKFDHTGAWRLLSRFMKNASIQPHGQFLMRVMKSRGQIDAAYEPEVGMNGHGYEIVEDLVLNAERRAGQERFDDAAGRLYRSLELLVQIRLTQAYGIRTGDVDVQKLPTETAALLESRRDPKSRKIRLALTDSYRLLSRMPEDPLGGLYQERENRILSGLEIRNQSIMAHGFRPVTAQDYDTVRLSFAGFIAEGIAAVCAKGGNRDSLQFPREVLL